MSKDEALQQLLDGVDASRREVLKRLATGAGALLAAPVATSVALGTPPKKKVLRKKPGLPKPAPEKTDPKKTGVKPDKGKVEPEKATPKKKLETKKATKKKPGKTKPSKTFKKPEWGTGKPPKK